MSFPSLPVLKLNLEITNPGALTPPDMEQLKQSVARGALAGGDFAKAAWLAHAEALGWRNSGPNSYVGGIQALDNISISDVRADSENWEVTITVTNTSPHASFVEHGRSAFHLPDKINWGGPNVKQGKNGPYLHIPFGHSAHQSAKKRETSGMTQGTLKKMMPAHIYRQAVGLERRIRNGAGRQHNAAGQFIAADKYHWGGDTKRRRLDRSGSKPSIIGGSGDGGPHNQTHVEHRSARTVGRDKHGGAMTNPAWKSSKFHGMMKTGSKGHTEYMTIRTITPNSAGWNIPAMAGYFIARKVSARLANDPRLPEIIYAGMMNVIPGGPS